MDLWEQTPPCLKGMLFLPGCTSGFVWEGYTAPASSVQCCRISVVTFYNIPQLRKLIAAVTRIPPAIPGQQIAPHERTVVTDWYVSVLHAVGLPVALQVGSSRPER